MHSKLIYAVTFLMTVALLTVACDTDVPSTETDAGPPRSGASLPTSPAEPADTTVQRMEIRSYLDLEDLFNGLNYTPEAWMAGIREVPRVFIKQIPERWSKHTVKEIDILTKKRLFFRVLGPLALRSNELILQDRLHLLELAGDTEKGAALQPDDEKWVLELAREYGIDGQFLDDEIEVLIADLTLRVDVVPVSLVLSQAAEESGWGTSRFAFTGNALFGQWTWGDGITPKEQRGGKGNYKIAAFDSPLESVQAHARNLNTHSAYREFRRERAGLRLAGENIRGRSLVGTLTSYSERGEGYIKTLRDIMRVNKLDEADDAFLVKMQPITLVPVDG